jgi:hypothetical protein
VTAPAPFVVGVGRSGTTLLRLMLDAHPDLAIPTETHFLPALAALPDDATPDQVADVMLGATTWPNMGLEADDLRAVFATLAPFSVGDATRAFFRLYAARFGKSRWGDKTPTYRSSLPAIARLLPEACFIHIIRDGRDVALSYRGLWFGPGDDVAAQARFWTDKVTGTRRDGASVQHYLEVRFEDLVADAEGVLRRICGFLDLAFVPEMLAYPERASARLGEFKQSFGPAGAGDVDLERFIGIHRSTSDPPDAAKVGRWRREMSQAEVKTYEAIAGGLLRQLGYETTGGAA